jgi:hypothetical protein
MIVNIHKLIKIADILNSEGSILTLYEIDKQLYLGLLLSGYPGMIYFSTDRKNLKKYVNSEINLQQVYLNSDDFFITRKLNHKTALFLKNDFLDLLLCGNKLYSDIEKSMKNYQMEMLLSV